MPGKGKEERLAEGVTEGVPGSQRDAQGVVLLLPVGEPCSCRGVG